MHNTGTHFNNVKISSTAKFYAEVCTLLNTSFTFQVHDAFMQLLVHRYRNITPAHSMEISDKMCFSPAYYPIRPCKVYNKGPLQHYLLKQNKNCRSEVLTTALLRSLLGCDAV
jgi:hypothetical protein